MNASADRVCSTARPFEQPLTFLLHLPPQQLRVDGDNDRAA